LPWVLLP